MSEQTAIVSKDRDESGKFKKGHKVPSPRRGRPARADTMPVLIAIAQEAYTSEELIAMLHETYEMAKEERAWKGMFDVIQLVVHYAVGKPVQRTLSATIDPNDIRAMFEGIENEQTGDTDAEVTIEQ